MHTSHHVKTHTRATALLLAALTAATGLTPLTAQTAAGSDDIAALREQIRLLDQKIRVLERNQELKDEAAEAKAKATPAGATVTLDGKGFNVASADKNFSFKIGALVQADYRAFLDDSAPNRDGFLLRRVRTPITGTAYKIFNFNITPEYATGDSNSTSNNNNTQLIDAWLDARISPYFGLKAGKFASPVVLEPGSNRHFNESPFPNNFAPNRDIGLEAFGSLAEGIVDYRLGIFNGVENNVTNRTGGLTDGDLTTAGRLTVTPFKKDDGILSKLAFSIGGSYGNERGTAGSNTSGLRSILSNGQQTVLNYGNSLFADGHHARVSPGIEWYTGTPFSVAAEFIWERQDISNGTTYNESIANTGWRVSAGYVLTGEAATKSGVSPKNAFNWENGTWGAFEVVARVSGADIDGKLFDGSGLSDTTNITGAFAYGAGLNWYLNNNIRALFNVEKTNFSGGHSGANTNDNELYFFTRLQVSF
ncbi:porin [Opitutaceae bacterium TAV4]|uniref:OprO/OprP family phosphate-selective porin n=1 Tax=Geminisphaera colitermitum TaxID=1148786 RepID=UPI000158CA13|nr:porin [Geminisphaera colitermitum]RRJ97716.1 porin [Opitutaceae bacterium TAV4]RRK02254.1 porin [Opitutaceae bacterium TAV3]